MPVISVFSGSPTIRELARGQPGGLFQFPAADRGQTVVESRLSTTVFLWYYHIVTEREP